MTRKPGTRPDNTKTLEDQIYDALRARGWIIPQTEEDVLRTEVARAQNPVPVPPELADPSALLNRLFPVHQETESVLTREEPTGLHCQQWIKDKATERIRHYTASLQALHDLTDLRNADNNTRQDYAGRFPFEMAQNGADAHDKAVHRREAGYERGQGRVAFVLTPTCLLVANTGTPFSHLPDAGESISSLESISRQGESTKQDAEYRGNKGLGLRSIYQICSRLWLVSGGYRVLYDGERTYQALKNRLESLKDPGQVAPEDVSGQHAYLETRKADGIPMTKVGFWFEEPDLPEEAREPLHRLRNEHFDTVLILEHARDEQTEGAITHFAWERIAELSERELLFLDGLCEIRAENRVDPSRSFTLRMRQEGSEALSLNVRREIYRIERTTRESAESHRFLVYRFPIPEMPHQRSAVAFRLNAHGCPMPAPSEERVFYTFYPASRERHGFPFYIHSYFRLSPNREFFDQEQASMTRNRKLLEYLAQEITAKIVPDLRSRYPALLLPQVLLPQLEEHDRSALKRLVGTGHSGNPLMDGSLTTPGALTAYFTREVLQHLAGCALVKDANGTWQQLGNLYLPHEPWLDEANDSLVDALCHIPGERLFPSGICGNARALRSILDGIAPDHQLPFFTPQLLNVTIIGNAVVAAGQSLRLSDAQAAALLSLIGHCPQGSSHDDPLTQIRETVIPILPCTSGLRPLPAPYVRGRKVEPPSAKTPLVFFRPERRDRSEDEEENSRVSLISPPAFCHVHVLRNEVIDAAPAHLGSGGLQQIVRNLGLREFHPQDIFVRVAEAVLGSEQVQHLTSEDHRALLHTTLGLLRRRVRSWVAEPRDLQPWFLRSVHDSDWDVHYWLAQSWLPLEGYDSAWVRADEVILAGRLGSGDSLRQYYPPTQRFLDEHNEPQWLCTLLNDLFDEGTKTSGEEGSERHEGTDLEQARLRFRRTVYRMLGVWGGLRLHVVHPRGGNNYLEALQSHPNPHRNITDEQWDIYVEQCRSHWQSLTFKNDGFRLLRSAALPHAEELATCLKHPASPDVRDVLWHALEDALPALERLGRVEVRNSNNRWGDTSSLLFTQLRDLPWVTEDRDSRPDRPIWYTRKRGGARTHPQREAHYLRAVTAEQLSERLARALGFLILEEPAPQQITGCEFCQSG